MKFQKAPKGELIAATSAQQFTYAVQLLARNNIVSFHRWQGSLDPTILSKAVAALMQQFPILCCGFEKRGDHVVHIVHDPKKVNSPVKSHHELVADIASFELMGTPAKVDAITHHLKLHKQFELDQPPLFDVYICHLSDSRTYLVTSIAHIIFDGGSVQPFFDRLKKYYQVIERGDAVSIPEKTWDYIDYAHSFTLANKNNALVDANMQWYESYLDSAQPAMPVSDGYTETTECEEVLYLLDQHTVQQLRAVAKKLEVTLSVVFLAVLGLTLHRETEEQSMFIGTAVDGRVYKELREMLGMLVKPAFLKMDIVPSQTLSDVVKGVASNNLQMLFHNELPVDRIIQLGQRHAPPLPGVLGNYITAIYDAYESFDEIVYNRWVGDLDAAEPGELLAYTTEFRYACFIRFLVSNKHVVINFGFSKAHYSTARSREFIQHFINTCKMFLPANTGQSVESLVSEASVCA